MDSIPKKVRFPGCPVTPTTAYRPIIVRPVLQYCLLLSLMFVSCIVTAETGNKETAAKQYASATVDTPLDEVEMQIKHLTTDQLEKEADRWLAILKKTIYDLNQTKIEVKRENELLSELPTGDEKSEALVQEEMQEKEETLDRVGELRELRLKIIDRLNVILDELSAKLGKTDEGNEQDVVTQYRLYIKAVEGIRVDVSDTQSTRATILSWLRSSEGGLRLLRKTGVFLGALLGFWLLGMVLSHLAGKALSLSRSASQILKKFVIDAVQRVTIVIGLLVGLSAVGVNITPLVAVIGAAGFVIAFALQNTLSNFASGLLIMLYKPFDIGDFVETSSVSGKVRSMTLMTTNMMTPDNKLLVVPNNELWGNVITNVTGSSERRVDLVFGIGYDDDIAHAERVLTDVVTAHPLVLEEPEPVIRVSELGDSSVNLICRPWVKTADYWPVFWELTRAVKERFDKEGISIPFPQRDVHLHHASSGNASSSPLEPVTANDHEVETESLSGGDPR